MHPLNELKQLREQMIDRLTQIPEYQALKAMERFIAEMTSIYEPGATQQEPPAQKQTPSIAEARLKNDTLIGSSPRVTPYVPAHRVA